MSDRMYCYLWHETTDVDECKFGERFVFDGQDPKEECLKRIRESLGVRKDKFGDTINPDHVVIWDVTELARTQCPERLKQHGRVDDYIRKDIGFRKGTTGEVHSLDATVMEYKVNEYLKKTKQPLPVAGLAQWQYDQAENVITAISDKKKVIMAELCARFGKTIWSGAISVETGFNITVVASYVLTSFASFAKDLNKFEQFRDMEIIDSGSDFYEQEIKKALKNNKQVVVFLSMCGSAKRQDRIDFIFGLKESRLVFIDEADYGAHTEKQADPFIQAKKPNDVVVLMTGTNGERACGKWKIEHYVGTTYPELLMERAGV
jgi:hypothetical protein